MSDHELVRPDHTDQWLELLEHRRVEIDLDARSERRVRAYAERLNARLAAEGDRDPFDLARDEDLGAVIMILCEAGLDAEAWREDGSS